jgi:hypothetical protein
VPTPDAVITLDLVADRCATTRGGCASPGILSYRPGPGLGRFAFYHELGHEFDFLEPAWERQRWRFLAIMRLGARWRTDTGHESPHEKFADAYAHCARSPRWPIDGRISGTTYYPTVSQHRKVCALIRLAPDLLSSSTNDRSRVRLAVVQIAPDIAVRPRGHGVERRRSPGRGLVSPPRDLVEGLGLLRELECERGTLGQPNRQLA